MPPEPLRSVLRPRKRMRERVTPEGLIVVTEGLTPEGRKARREDNKAMAKSRKFHRTTRNGKRQKTSVKNRPWLKAAKAKTKERRNASN